jgi:hypothetical protein
MADKSRYVYYVIGDPNLNANNGGLFLKSLPDIKASLMKLAIKEKWTLVLSMHGSENIIADQTQALAGGKGAYDAAAITALFDNDAKFTAWRDKWGPSRLVLNSCAVTAQFERVLIQAFTKKGTSQSAQGLGGRCAPHTTTYTLNHNNIEIKTWADWQKLPKDVQTDLKKQLDDLNQKWGYFGGPPVDGSLVLQYYFDQPPKGGWPVVEVASSGKGIGVSFHDRAAKPKFHDACVDAAPLRGRTSRVPTVP